MPQHTIYSSKYTYKWLNYKNDITRINTVLQKINTLIQKINTTLQKTYTIYKHGGTTYILCKELLKEGALSVSKLISHIAEGRVRGMLPPKSTSLANSSPLRFLKLVVFPNLLGFLPPWKNLPSKTTPSYEEEPAMSLKLIDERNPPFPKY